MKKIEILAHLGDGKQPKAINIAEDATIEQLLKELRVAGATFGESGEEIVLWVENKEVACRKEHKIHECGIKHGHHVRCHSGKIKVKVSYTGHDEYEGEFSPETTIGAIKLKAMEKFEIERAAADQYLLQHAGVNLDEKTKIGDFGNPEVKLVLLRKKPQEKGHA